MENLINKYIDEIATLRRKLIDTDYKAIKYAEGLITATEYQAIKIQRNTWRSEINTLEGKIKELGG